MQSREMATNSGGDTVDHRSYDAGAARRVADEDDAESENDWRVRMVSKLSLGVNVLLLVIKTIVLVSTGSLAVLAGTIDSCLDIFSCTVIFLTNRYMSKTNRYLFPMGEQYMPPTATATATATTILLSLLVAFVEHLCKLAFTHLIHSHVLACSLIH